MPAPERALLPVDAPAYPSGDLAPLMTFSQVADLFGVHVATVRRWVSSGMLRAVRLTRRTVRFRPADVAAFIDRRAGLSPVRASSAVLP